MMKNYKLKLLTILFILGCSISIIISLPVCSFSNGLHMTVQDFYDCYKFYYSGIKSYYGEPCISDDMILESLDVPTTYYSNTTEIYKNLGTILLQTGYSLDEIEGMSFHKMYFTARKEYAKLVTSNINEECIYVVFSFPKYSIDINLDTLLPINQYYSKEDVELIRYDIANGKYSSYLECTLIGKDASGYFNSISLFDNTKKLDKFVNGDDLVSPVFSSAENNYFLVKYTEKTKKFLSKLEYSEFLNKTNLTYDNARNKTNFNFIESICHLDRVDSIGSYLAKALIRASATYGEKLVDIYCVDESTDRNDFIMYMNNLPSYLSTVNYYNDVFSTVMNSLVYR